MKLAIIGCGYVGTAVGQALVEAGHDVVGTTTSPQRVNELRDASIQPIVLRIDRLPALHDAVSDREAVYLTLAAGRQHTDYRAVYVDGVSNLLEACRETPVRRIIYTSSTSVYGQTDGSWVDEDSPTEPATESGRWLLEAERRLLDSATHINPVGRTAETVVSNRRSPGNIIATVVRLAGIYGPGREPANWFRRTSGTQRSDGDVCLNLVHLDDIVTALVGLLDVSYHGVLNLVDDGAVPRREFYNRLAGELGMAPPIWIAPDGEPNRGRRVRNDRIKRTLGLTLKHPRH